jgi:lycopene beta-cyclase
MKYENPNNPEYIVVGAGCAGLSLAVHLARTDRNFRVTIVDRRAEFTRDRTWCYWATESHPFEECVQRRWNRWIVQHDSRTTEQHSERYPYEMIPADAFYDHALEVVRSDPRFNLILEASVQSIEPHSTGVRVLAQEESFDGDAVFDSRPPSPSTPDQLQHFLGWFIEVEDPVFDPSRVRLMDFWRPEAENVHFIYQLPLSPDRSLFEATWISETRLADDVYEQHIEEYLERTYPNTNYSIYRREQGVIPLQFEPVDSDSRRILPIGSRGGASRPSTGYTFLGIQRASRQLAEEIEQGCVPTQPKIWSSSSRMLDRIFLSYLEGNPRKAQKTFYDLFERTNTEALVRFLSDVSRVSDYRDVLASMPKLDMIQEACSLMIYPVNSW